MIQGGGSKVIYPDLSFKIIGIIFDVYNIIGPGFKEQHYQKALEVAFEDNKINFISQAPYKIKYRDRIIGRYYIDFIIEGRIVLEIKRNDHFSKQDFDQVNGYLRATGHQLGILVSFSRKNVKFKRILNIK